MAKTEEAAPVLFAEPTFDDYTQATKASRRDNVDVPEEILDTLRLAQRDRKRPVWPVRDANHFDTMATVLYSAGDKLGASVTVQALKRTAEGTEILKKELRNEATHLRATVGAKRGRKSDKDKAEEALALAEKAVQAANANANAA
jgi:hypothetical protein